jgi:hypothetical protein
MNTPPETTTPRRETHPKPFFRAPATCEETPLQIQALDGPSKVYVAYY